MLLERPAQELAEQLHVVGLYRLSRYTPRVDYALAICLRPDGTYWALLPQQPDHWLLLNKASQMIGGLFYNKKAKMIDLPREELAHFAAHVFISLKDVPTLVLFEAADRYTYPQSRRSLQPTIDRRPDSERSLRQIAHTQLAAL